MTSETESEVHSLYVWDPAVAFGGPLTLGWEEGQAFT